jgi:hypothetical protein
MVDLLQSKAIITKAGVDAAQAAKVEKLKKWSNIYE